MYTLLRVSNGDVPSTGLYNTWIIMLTVAQKNLYTFVYLRNSILYVCFFITWLSAGMVIVSTSDQVDVATQIRYFDVSGAQPIR